MRLLTLGATALVVMCMVTATPASAIVVGLDWGLGNKNLGYGVLLDNQIVLGGNLYAGAFSLYLNGTLGNPLPPNDGVYSGQAFCVNLAQVLSGIPTEFEANDLTTGSLANGGKVAWLTNRYTGQLQMAYEAAALQLAIWDAIYDNGDGLDSGRFRRHSGGTEMAWTMAETFITSAEGKSSSARFLDPVGYGQGMVTPVPEPQTVALLGIGLGVTAMGVARRRKTQR